MISRFFKQPVDAGDLLFDEIITADPPIGSPLATSATEADNLRWMDLTPGGVATKPVAVSDYDAVSAKETLSQSRFGTTTEVTIATANVLRSSNTNSASQPTLSIDATNPADVTFTVSGLERGYSGTVTFTDASDHKDIVPIESNGAYSADLANLKDGTITYLLSVSNAAGDVITVDPPVNLGDGSANAPAGTPQLPNLVSGYAVRPPWNVAGVDYAVGVVAGTVLKDPSTISTPGVSVNTATHTVTINGNNVVLNGYDFSLDGGWRVSVNGGSNITIENSNFVVGSNNLTPIYVSSGASNVTIQYNSINGNGSTETAQMLVGTDGAGTTTIEYNLIQNAWGQNIVMSSDVGGENWVVQHNVIANSGEGFSQGAHGDWIQTYNAPGKNTNSFDLNYNTFLQTIPISQGRTQGVSAFSANSGPTSGGVQTESFSNNTFIGESGAYVNYGIILDTTRLIGTATIQNNYFDTSGIGSSNGGGGSWDFVGDYNGSNGGPYHGTVTTLNNVNMVTGLYYTQNVTSVRQVTSSQSTGTEIPGDVITLTLDFTAAVTVTGTPTLTLNDGGTATYTGGSGTSALAFSYTVSANDSNVSNLAITRINLPNGATIKDGSGDAANLTNALTTLWGLQIDSSTPSPTLNSITDSPSSGDLNAGKTVTFTLNLNEAVTVASGTPTLTLNDGGTATYIGGSGTSALIFSYTVGAGQNTAALAATAVNLNSATITDGAGNAAALSLSGLTQSGPQIDTLAPSIASLAESPASGDLNAGKTVTFTLNLNEAVTVAGGTPTLSLNDGGTATYNGGSGTDALTFSYTVLQGQNTPDLMETAVNLNGATIADGAGNIANLSLVGVPQGSPQVDTTTPTITSLTESPASADLNAGKTVTFTLNLNEAVTVAGGTPTLTLNDGGTATYSSGSGTNALSFSYTVGAGQNTAALAATAVNLNSATIADGAGNAANLALSGLTQSGPQIDAITPTVSSLVESPANGELNVGNTVTLTLNLSETVTVAGGTPTLTLNNGGIATYIVGSGTNALTFSYTVGVGQSTFGLAATAVNLKSATITDSAGNAANLSLSGLTQSGPQIDALSLNALTPTVSSLVESPAGGDLNAGKTVTLTLNLSEAVTVAGGVPTLTLNDGGTATYAGGSGTNALTFSYTVGAGQNTSALAATAVNLNSATISDGAGNAANLSLSGLTQSGPQIDTVTPTAPVISSFTPNSGTAFGSYTDAHALTLTGSALANTTVEVFDGSALAGTARVNGSGAWSYTTTSLSNGTQSFTAKDVDAAGNVSSASAALTVAIVTAAKLTKINNHYFVNTTTSDPEVQYAGSPIVAGQFGAWTPIATVQTASGYDIAWNLTGTNEYTVWTTDNNGNYTGNLIGAVSGKSYAFESIEPVFQQDLNGDGVIGVTTTVIRTDGSTSLTEVANQFYLDGISGSDPTLQYAGAAFTAGEFGGWTPIGAVQTATGYDIAWNLTGTNEYTVWTTDNNGNYTGNLIGAVSGNSYAFESIEPVFQQDLNGDGVIGVTTAVIRTDGSTSLTEVANQFYLDGRSGSDPALQYAGAAFTAGEFGGWTPIGAVQTATGYDVAWKNTASGQYTVWATDNNGNYAGNLIGAVSGNSYALESFEPVFQQDLNGDGVVGLYAAPATTLQITQALSGASGAATVGAGATCELAAGDSASVTFAASTGMLKLDQPSTFSAEIFGFTGNGSLSGSDQIDLKGINYTTVADSYANGVLTVSDGTGDTAKLSFNGSYTLANFNFASDGAGGTTVYDPPAASSSGQGAPTPFVANVALLSNYMASSFAASGHNSGVTMPVADAAQASDQSVLSNPHHA